MEDRLEELLAWARSLDTSHECDFETVHERPRRGRVQTEVYQTLWVECRICDKREARGSLVTW